MAKPLAPSSSTIPALRRPLGLLGVSLLLGLSGYSPKSSACGPFFPESILQDRAGVLQRLPDAPFSIDAARLLPHSTLGPRLLVVSGEPERVRVACRGRSCALYDEGAQAFHAGDLPLARARFQAVVAMGNSEPAPRVVWAAYMLCRLDAASCLDVRERVAAGAPDPLGLAAASLGTQAGLAYQAGDVVSAITLYAEEAARGDVESATESLVIVARNILSDDTMRRQAFASPVGQRLIASYAMHRLPAPSPELSAAVDVLIAQAKRGPISWADRAAGAAYRQGRYSDAALLVAQSPDTPLGLWVRAKLALRQGNAAGAAALMREAAVAFPAVDVDARLSDNALEYVRHDQGAPRAAVLGDEAILALERGDYVLAFDRLYEGGFWQDAAYVADRVLTLDELIAVVKARPDGPDERALRQLLGRRLVRAQRFGDAMFYLDHQTRSVAAELAAMAQSAKHSVEGEVNIDVAEALYHGAVIMGTEVGPDFALHGGSFEYPDIEPAAGDEATRVASSGPVPDQRFHYRGAAASMLEHAARHTPTHTQAYAAVLCQATRYARDHPDEMRRLWQLYVDNGPLDITFTGAFGSAYEQCPDPDFAAARAGRLSGVLPSAPVLPIVLAVAGIVGIAAFFAVVVGRRPRRHRP